MKPGWFPALRVPKLPPLTVGERCVLAVGTGLGSGFLRPFAPSWGGLVGFGYAALLLHVESAGICAAITLAVLAVSVPVAGKCARLIGEPDPKCVVIDELACAPLALLPALWLPPLTLWQWALAFVAYRIADYLKPFPARRLEALPGGWGIMLDDVVSALWMSGLWALGLFTLRHG